MEVVLRAESAIAVPVGHSIDVLSAPYTPRAIQLPDNPKFLREANVAVTDDGIIIRCIVTGTNDIKTAHEFKWSAPREYLRHLSGWLARFPKGEDLVAWYNGGGSSFMDCPLKRIYQHTVREPEQGECRIGGTFRVEEILPPVGELHRRIFLLTHKDGQDHSFVRLEWNSQTGGTKVDSSAPQSLSVMAPNEVITKLADEPSRSSFFTRQLIFAVDGIKAEGVDGALSNIRHSGGWPSTSCISSKKPPKSGKIRVYRAPKFDSSNDSIGIYDELVLVPNSALKSHRGADVYFLREFVNSSEVRLTFVIASSLVGNSDRCGFVRHCSPNTADLIFEKCAHSLPLLKSSNLRDQKDGLKAIRSVFEGDDPNPDMRGKFFVTPNGASVEQTCKEIGELVRASGLRLDPFGQNSLHPFYRTTVATDILNRISAQGLAIPSKTVPKSESRRIASDTVGLPAIVFRHSLNENGSCSLILRLVAGFEDGRNSFVDVELSELGGRGLDSFPKTRDRLLAFLTQYINKPEFPALVVPWVEQLGPVKAPRYSLMPTDTRPENLNALQHTRWGLTALQEMYANSLSGISGLPTRFELPPAPQAVRWWREGDSSGYSFSCLVDGTHSTFYFDSFGLRRVETEGTLDSAGPAYKLQIQTGSDRETTKRLTCEVALAIRTAGTPLLS